MKKNLIAIVEDDQVIAELIEYNLRNEGYDVMAFQNGDALLAKLRQLEGICLFILDIMLPGMDGFEICAHIRTDEQYDYIPILMLTARGTEADKVRGLKAGADDYLTKPFGIRELLARVEAHVRRFHMMKEPSRLIDPSPKATPQDLASASTLVCGQVCLDDSRHRVFLGDQEIEVTNREYELLKFLMVNRGIAFSREELLTRVWGYDYAGETRTVDVHIRQLRKKLEEDDANPTLIQTVRGRGYRFCDTSER